MSKHTKGPWTVAQDSDGTLDVNYADNIARSRIARLHVECLAEEHGGSIAANARLIAAAPCLLEALQYALFYLKERAPKEYAIARAAIAKAEGNP